MFQQDVQPNTWPCASQTANVIIFMYHNVGDFHSPGDCMHNDCHIERFKAQMAYLKRFGYTVISLSDAVRGLFEGGPLPQKPVVLSFDDGYGDFRKHVFPVLQEFGYPAVVYAVAGWLGKSAEWLNSRGLNPPLMDAQALREVQAGGVEVGSHSFNHVHLDRLTGDEAKKEVHDSKSALEDVLGSPVDHFCYPYGDYSEQVRNFVMEAGYRSATSLHRGAANFSENPYELLRKSVNYRHTLLSYFFKLNFRHGRRGRRVKQESAQSAY